MKYQAHVKPIPPGQLEAGEQFTYSIGASERYTRLNVSITLPYAAFDKNFEPCPILDHRMVYRYPVRPCAKISALVHGDLFSIQEYEDGKCNVYMKTDQRTSSGYYCSCVCVATHELNRVGVIINIHNDSIVYPVVDTEEA